MSSMALTVAELDRLHGDIAATQYLLDDALAERDRLARQVETLKGELDGLRAQLAWQGGR